MIPQTYFETHYTSVGPTILQNEPILTAEKASGAGTGGSQCMCWILNSRYVSHAKSSR